MLNNKPANKKQVLFTKTFLLKMSITNKPAFFIWFSKTDMYLLGLSGCENSEIKRKKLLSFLQLPTNLSANAMLDIVNTLFTKDEFIKAVNECQNQQDKN